MSITNLAAIFSRNKNNYLFLLIALAAVFLAMLPLKDQLFSEDFAYAQSVRHFINTGDLKVSERVAPTSITHIVWGSIVTKPLGFSLANLHLSIVMLLPFLLIAMYEIFKLAASTNQKSIIFTLFFLSIPWILQISYTFETDITFLTLEVFALLFYLRGFKQKKLANFLFGSIFASLAFLTRQLGIVIALAAFVTILSNENDTKQKLKKTLLSISIPAATAFIYLWWLSIGKNRTIAQYAVYQEIKNMYFHHPLLATWFEDTIRIIHRALNFTSEALGLLFPIIFLLFLSNHKRIIRVVKKNKKGFIIATVVTFGIYALDVIYFRKEYTVGFPLIIYQYEALLPIPWAHLWKYIVLLSLPAAASTIYLQAKHIFKLNSLQRFIFLSFIFLAILTLVYVASWEVYIVPFLPLLMFWIAALTKKFTLNTKLSLIVVLILLLDSVQMTKLRYSESGLMWEKSMSLVQNGVSPIEIDPNNNYGWYYWFYYEKLASDSINANGGNKQNLNYGFIIPKPDLPRYRIYDPRMVSYSNLDTSNYKVEQIPFRSLFVKSKIYFMQLNGQ